MSEEKLPDTRSFGRKLLAAALAAVLAIAVPIARCTSCNEAGDASVDPREPALVDGYVGGAVPQWASESEGLRYLPASVVVNLKRPAKDGLKLLNEPLFGRPERFGMLPDPDGGKLPLGVTVTRDPSSYAPMVGITCAACHIGAVSNGKQWMLVPGAPNLMTVNVFFGEMIKSLAATLSSPVEFDELWKAYAKEEGLDVGEKNSPGAPISKKQAQMMLENPSAVSDPTLADAYPTRDSINTREKLAAYLVVRLAELISRAKGGDDSVSYPLGTSNPWTTTRALFGDKWAHSPDIKLTPGPITAPDIFRYGERKWVFWAQVTNSMVERNLAQGLALLGDINWETKQTTLSESGLNEIQELTENIEPPFWPSMLLGDVDKVSAAKGCTVFKNKCAGCHEYEHVGARGNLEFRMYDVKTDPLYCEGVNVGVGVYPTVPELVAPVAKVVKERVFGQSPTEEEQGRYPVIWRPATCNKLPARSLEGVWSTAPYLHNGSVRTIDDLLKPSEQREKRFNVGSIEYDVEKLGFVSSTLPHNTVVDTMLPGMSNIGHEIIVDDAGDRAALLEYLKIHEDGNACEGL